MKKLCLLVALTAVLLAPAPAAASSLDFATLAIGTAVLQPAPIVRNPSIAEWNCPDHDSDSNHELKFLRIEGTNKVVITTILLGDPAYADAATKLVRTSINVQPIAFGEYVATMRAVVDVAGVPLYSDDSAESNRFQRVPGKPSVIIK